MKVTVNTPKPVVVPPPTYNLELTEEEFLALRSLVARRDNRSVTILEPLRLQMWAVSRGKISPFKIEQTTLRLAAYHIRKKTDEELRGF
jgi:hypothetical protein